MRLFADCLGDADPGLLRLGPPIEEAATEQWLLVHRDLRVLPRIRGVMDALVALFQAERGVIEGRGLVAVSSAAE